MKTIIFLLISVLIFPTGTAAKDKSDRILADIFKYNDSSPRSIELSELSQGCPRVNCIPSINNPTFTTIENIDYIRDRDVIMHVNYNGVQKAYPRKIMQVHEIVNDSFASKPLVMTYCPLCGTSVAFEPFIDGKVVEFGVSGLLHNSDLVMYDRQTFSLWGQITGRAIVGPKTGTRLKAISAAVMTWAQLKENYPESLILLPPTNNRKTYKKFRYKDYTRSEKLMFPVAAKDARLSSKKFVYGIEIDDQFIAFEEKLLIKKSPMVESFGKYTLQVTHENGQAQAIDKKTGKVFPILRVYWFAWYAFHPETQLRK